MKKFLSCMVIILFIAPVFSQDANKDQGKSSDTDKVTQKIYTEEIIEDFESSQYTAQKSLKYDVTNQQLADLQMRDQFPAQYNNSKKYLGVKVFGKRGDVFRIVPEKPFVIKKYCRDLNVWVYGKGFSGELIFVIQDVNDTVHNVSFGRLNFNGWRKLTAEIKPKIKQQNEYLEQEKSFKILFILYKPANDTQVPIWHYFYLDDITATVRDKYKDNQSDAWGIGYDDKKEEGK